MLDCLGYPGDVGNWAHSSSVENKHSCRRKTSGKPQEWWNYIDITEYIACKESLILEQNLRKYKHLRAKKKRQSTEKD